MDECNAESDASEHLSDILEVGHQFAETAGRVEASAFRSAGSHVGACDDLAAAAGGRDGKRVVLPVHGAVDATAFQL